MRNLPIVGVAQGAFETKQLMDYAENGGTIPAGTLVYRSDSRTWEELQSTEEDMWGIKKEKLPGFVPAVYLRNPGNPGKTEQEVLKLAKEQMKKNSGSAGRSFCAELEAGSAKRSCFQGDHGG